MNTSHTVNEFFLYARGWTLYSLKNIDAKQIIKQPKCDKIKLNNFLWFAGHILWTEEMLIANPLGRRRRFKGIKLTDFAINTKPQGVLKYRNKYSEIVKHLENSKKTMSDLILSVKETDWKEPWSGKYSNYFNTKLFAVKHCILHEASHAGQIWINEKLTEVQN